MRDHVLPLSTRAPQLVGSVIDSSTSLLASQTHDVVRFAMGAPSDDLVPVDHFDRLLGAPAQGKYGYGATEGEPELVGEIVGLEAARGRRTDPNRIVVTSGGMQGLDLACKLFIDPGDLVVVEGPTYTNGNSTFLSYGAQPLEAPIDQDGLIVEALPELVLRAGRTPKAIYTIPNFQNPSGTTLSLPRRRLLLELAEQWGAVIVDDDPYGMLRFEGEDVDGFASIDPGNARVFAVRTFSKVLAPGLRVGWVDADPSLQQLLVNAKQAMDTCTNVPGQNVAWRFLREGLLDGHLERVLQLYKQRKDVMRASIDRHFGTSAQATDPDGGFFLWLRLVDDLAAVDTQELFADALRAGVAYIPGPAFSTTGAYSDSLRLCFATSSPERIEEGVARLRAAVDHHLESRPRTGSTSAPTVAQVR
jgi:2-aminoadipate transaminase